MTTNPLRTDPEEAAGRSTAELLDRVDELMRQNRASRDPELERRIVQLRHLAGIQQVRDAPGDPQYPEPAFDALPDGSGLAEVGPEDLSPELLRAAILRHGYLLVRGLFERDVALELADEIEASFAARDSVGIGNATADGYYQEFTAEPGYEVPPREFIAAAGGILGPDSPRVMVHVLETLERIAFNDLANAYLGEQALLSFQKTTLRKAEPQVVGRWHQDGSFLGEVRPLNLWLSLSRCGDTAPGLDILPMRLDRVLPAGGEETMISIEVHDSHLQEAAGGVEIVRPIYEPGDAMLFDELFLHRTASDPEMPNPRYAIESWFFGASSLTPEYAPIAV